MLIFLFGVARGARESARRVEWPFRAYCQFTLPLFELCRSDLVNLHQYALNNAPAGWTGSVGFVTKEMIEKVMPAGGVGSADHGIGHKVLMCGPPPMMTAMK